MNILLINHYAGTPLCGMEYRPYYLAREWTRLGHKVRILAGSYSHIRMTQPCLNSTASVMEVIDGIEYLWFHTPTYKGNGLGRVRSIVSFVFSILKDARKIAVSFKPDVVIASSTYPMDIWPAERIAKFSKAKLIYEVHDLWPLSPIELGGMSKWHPFILWVQCAEDHAYKVVDRVVSMLPKTLDYMKSRGLQVDKWSYVPNGINLEDWSLLSPLPADTFNKLVTIKKRGKPILAYTGTLGLANSLDVLLDASRFLKGKIEILIVGTGPECDRLMQRIFSEKLINVTMIPPVPKATIPALLDEIDIAFIGFLPQPLYRFGISPNKLFDYMMAGKPIIQAIQAENDLVSEVGCGITVPPNDPRSIAESAVKLASMGEDERQKFGRLGKTYVEENRTYDVLANRMLNLF